MIYKKWILLREAFTDWLSKWPSISNSHKFFNWRGYSLIWSSNLYARDSYINNSWLVDLCNKVVDGDVIFTGSGIKKRSSLYLITSFLQDLFQHFLLLFFRNTVNVDSSNVIFFSLDINLRRDNGLFVDRHYSSQNATIPELETSNFSSCYLLKTSFGINELLHPIQFISKLNNYSKDFSRPIHIANKYVSLFDILAVHFSIIYFWFKLHFLKFNRNYRSSFTILGVDCYHILSNEFEKSFYGPLQNSLLQGLMVRNFLRKNFNSPRYFVNYLELSAVIRATYFFIKNLPVKHTTIALQHAISHKNKLGFYYRRAEFNYLSNDFIIGAPTADFYFVHGPQFRKIASEFFPNNSIREIGFVKFDHLLISYPHRSHFSDHTPICRRDDDFVILLAPTVGADVHNLLRLFTVPFSQEKYRIILSPHPLANSMELLQSISDLNLNALIEMYPDYTTYELMLSCDLVVCGYSSTAVESLFLGIPSIRILDESSIPFVEDEDAIPYATSPDDFWHKVLNVQKGFNDSAVRLMLEYYFNDLTHKSSSLFWLELSKIMHYEPSN